MLFYYMIWLISCFFSLNKVIISNMDTQPNIYLPSESKHLVNKWKSQVSINYHINYCAHSDPTAGALFTPNTILLRILSLFKYGFFNYLKQNWKLLRRHLFQNISLNLSDSHLRLKSTTFKKIWNIRSSKHKICFALLHAFKDQTNIRVHLEKWMFWKHFYTTFLCHLVI